MTISHAVQYQFASTDIPAEIQKWKVAYEQKHKRTPNSAFLHPTTLETAFPEAKGLHSIERFGLTLYPAVWTQKGLMTLAVSDGE